MYNDYFYIAELTGSQQSPPVHTYADGTALFHVSKNKNEIRYRLAATNLTNMTQAHIHVGRRNINGPVIAFLSNKVASPGEKEAILEGFLTADDLTGPLKDKSISDLVDLMNAGKAYVSIQTKSYPDGEIRGKITQN
ncbi:CHRD domain-containing protein [Oceanobacillus sp. FSL K6-2867]|uniref:CHRD domain-containing protein n=1 Tax=Oceanobacillus sp. FSL K6-2867 TaxID=2954748 RepID=UPI0030D9EC01